MLKILIVDDSEGWRNFNKVTIQEIAGEDKVGITTAESASDGYTKLLLSAKEPYDLIISDLQMESDFLPMTAGEWFITQVKNFPEYKNTKIIIISGMYNIEMIADSLQVEFLSKRMLVSGELALKFKLEEMGII